MNALLNGTSHVNGDQPTINGRGLAHRKRNDELVDLAVDMATGTRPFRPSLASLLTGIPVATIRQRIKARAVQADAYATRRKAEAEAIDTLLDDVSLDHLLERVVDRFDVPSLLERLDATFQRRGFAGVMAPDTEQVTIEPDHLAAQ
jgi:hypothetical protein